MPIDFDKDLKTWRDAAPPETLKPRIAAALAPRPSFRLKPALAALAACAVAVSIGLLWPGSPARPLPAFADVEKAMSKVQSAAWSEKVTCFPRDVLGRNSQIWVRRNPPAIASWDIEKYIGPSHTVHNDRQFATHYIRTNRVFMHSQKKADESIARDVEQTLRSLTELPKGNQSAEKVMDAFDQGLEAGFRGTDATFVRTSLPWKSERTTLEGQAVLKFTREINRVVTPPRNRQGTRKTFQAVTEQTLWTDTVTLRVIRAEWRLAFDGKPTLVLMRSNFRYDQPAPPGTFELAAPPGASIQVEADSEAEPAQGKRKK